MKKTTTVVLLLSVALCGFSPERPYDSAIESCRSYELGQSRESLNVIEKAVHEASDDAEEAAILAERIATLLEEDTTYQAKDFACRQLSLIGTEEQVPVLSEMLKKEQLSDIARYALERIPGESADKALVDALGETEGLVRIGVINSITARRTDGAVEALKNLAEGSDSDVSEAAFRALGKIGGDSAAEFLRQAYEEDGKIYQGEAYLECAESYLAAGETEKARSVYETVLVLPSGDLLRHAALRGLFVLLNEEDQTEKLLAMLSEGEEALSLAAAGLVRETPGDYLVERMAGAMVNMPTGSQIALLKAFADKKSAAGLMAAKKAADSSDESVKRAALGSVGVLGGAEEVPLLSEKLISGNEEVEEAAHQGLVMLTGEGVNDAIVAEIEKADAGKAVALIDVLTERHATGAASAVAGLLGRPEAEVRKAALSSLRYLGTENEMPELIERLSTIGDSERGLLEKAMSAITRRSQDPVATIQALDEAFDESEQPTDKISIVHILGDVDRPESLTTIRKALRSDDENLRFAAVQALSAWKTPDAMGDLVNVASAAEQMTQRVLALRGYVDQIGMLEALPPERKLQLYKVAMMLAENDSEKKRVLSGVAQVHSVDALEFVQDYVPEESLREEAVIAWAEVAKNIYVSHRNAVESALQAAGNLDLSENARNRIEEVSGLMKQLDEYLTELKVSGYYQQEGKGCTDLFDIAFAPEFATGEVDWNPMDIFDLGQPWFMNIEKALGSGDDRVAYLKTVFESEEGGLANLEMGSDDGIKAWLNGELVHANNAVRGYTRDSDKVKVELEKGFNTLLLKITQANAGWGASARIRKLDEDGQLPDSVELVEDLLEFERSQISDRTFEAAAVFDVNNDGTKDIVCGGFWYPGPKFEEEHKILDVQQAGEYFDDFSDYPMDVNGDGYMDIITGGFWGNTLRWRENPKGQPEEWKEYIIGETGGIETTRFWDVDGDGFVEAVPNASGRIVAYQLVRDSEGKGTGEFKAHVLMPSGGGHGLGFGDVNGDGRGDFIYPNGWLEAPEKAFEEEWIRHDELGLGAPSVPILLHDVNEDGVADLIVGESHGYGLYWMEQKLDDSGARSWRRHDIDPNRSQYHDLALHDIDNDGTMELITGKRYRAHCGNDPGSTDPVGIYYFEIDKGTFRRGVIDYGTPEDHSGAGIYFWVEDIDGDGWKDIVAPGKEGLYLFVNERR